MHAVSTNIYKYARHRMLTQIVQRGDVLIHNSCHTRSENQDNHDQRAPFQPMDNLRDCLPPF